MAKVIVQVFFVLTLMLVRTTGFVISNAWADDDPACECTDEDGNCIPCPTDEEDN